MKTIVYKNYDENCPYLHLSKDDPFANCINPAILVRLALIITGLLTVKVVITSILWIKTLVTRPRYSELSLRRRMGMVAREMVEEFLNNKYRDGIVTLYINTKKKEYTVGSLQTGNEINDELIETFHLAVGLGNDFVATIFPNPIDDSLKFIGDIKELEIDEDEDEGIMLTIPTHESIERTGGGTLILIFGTKFSGALVVAYDHRRKLQDSVVVNTEKGIQITH